MGDKYKEIDSLQRKGDQAGTKKRAMHIKRFDPSNKQSFALVIKKEERKEGDTIGGKKNKK